ncbi:MAG: hypothetical protein AAGA03_20340 [Planctomycetota bacterium]
MNGDEQALRQNIRLVQGFVALGLLWKWKLFVQVDHVYDALPQTDTFFPAALQSLVTLRLAYCFAVAGSLAGVFLRGIGPLRLATVAQTAALTILMIHQGSYNDATFLTSWWAAVWCSWVAGQMERRDAALTGQRAARLACLILSLIMLGPAIGKWTIEYWSGEVFYEIYYRSRDFWVYNGLRDSFDASTLRRIAMLHARFVIVVESISGLTLWCLPPRVVGWVALGLMLAIPITNNWLLFSVTLSMTGLSLALLRQSRRAH